MPREDLFADEDWAAFEPELREALALTRQVLANQGESRGLLIDLAEEEMVLVAVVDLAEPQLPLALRAIDREEIAEAGGGLRFSQENKLELTLREFLAETDPGLGYVSPRASDLLGLVESYIWTAPVEGWDGPGTLLRLRE